MIPKMDPTWPDLETSFEVLLLTAFYPTGSSLRSFLLCPVGGTYPNRQVSAVPGVLNADG